jgi:hypothetical protein
LAANEITSGETLTLFGPYWDAYRWIGWIARLA